MSKRNSFMDATAPTFSTLDLHPPRAPRNFFAPLWCSLAWFVAFTASWDTNTLHMVKGNPFRNPVPTRIYWPALVYHPTLSLAQHSLSLFFQLQPPPSNEISGGPGQRRWIHNTISVTRTSWRHKTPVFFVFPSREPQRQRLPPTPSPYGRVPSLLM